MRQAEGVAPLGKAPKGHPFQRAGGGSLERSFQWTLSLLVVSLFVAVTGAAVWISREAAQQFVASRLSHDADAIVAGLAPAPRQITRPVPPVFSQPFSGHYFVVRFQDGTLLRSRSLWDESLAVLALPPGETKLDQQKGPQGQRLLVWKAGHEKDGQPFTVAVAEDLNPILQALRRLLWTGSTLSLLAGVLLLLVQRWLLRRGFRRIDSVRADIQRLAAGEISRLAEEVPAEVQPLVRELNQLIDGWQQHIERSRNTLGQPGPRPQGTPRADSPGERKRCGHHCDASPAYAGTHRPGASPGSTCWPGLSGAPLPAAGRLRRPRGHLEDSLRRQTA
jgi:HAMP domain-containing protein